MSAVPCLGLFSQSPFASFAFNRSRSRATRALLAAMAMVCLLSAAARAQTTLTVNTLADSNDGSCTVTTCSLRDAINQANSDNDGDTITFQSGLTGTITLGSALPTINTGLTITGPGANLLTVSGAGKYQVLTIAPAEISVSISGLTIANGYSSENSGGITSNSTGAVTVSNCVFSGNTGLAGGAIGAGSAAAITGSLTAGNSTFIVTNSTFYNNVGEVGGAILGIPLTLTNSTFYNNSSDDGGAVATAGSSTVTNNTFVDNKAIYYTLGYGGGIYNNNGALTANNNIFYDNSSSGGGAGIYDGSSGTVNGSNNVYYQDSTNGSEDDCYSCTTGGPGSDANFVATSNPLTLPLALYGGTTATLPPQPGSPAICAGSASLASSAGLTTDQRGFPLKAGNCLSTQVDAGSVQSNALIVTNLNGTSDASPDCTSGTGTSCSLVDAMAQASTDGSADISFLSTLTSTASAGTIPLSAGLTITGAVDLRGPGANQLTVSGGNSASVGSVFTVNSGAIALLRGLTVANGNNSDASSGGGGIANSGTLTVLDSAITANAASDAGGGVYSSGTLTMEDSTVSGNTGGNGGGIYSSGTLNMAESTVSGNSGSGIYTSGTSTITGSTIAGNTDNGTGGGISATGSLTLANSIVAGNTGNSGANIDGSYTNNGGNAIGGSTNATNNTSTVTGAAITLSPLQLNGLNATLETMIPLPGSAAICAGLASGIPSGTTTDERGYPNTNTSYAGYSSSSPCVDAGAVQTNYTSVAFVQQPAGSTASVNGSTAMNLPISPAPTVEVLETDTLLSGSNTDAMNGIPVTLSYSGGAGELTAPDNVLTETTTGGLATYALAPNTAGTDFTLSTSAIAVVGSDSLGAVTSYGFNVAAVPTVTGISPATGPTFGGTSVTITGTGLSNATAVDFGGVAATNLTLNSASQITAVSPAVTSAQTVNVTVTTPGGTSATSAANQFTYLVLTATSLTPTVTPGTTFVFNSPPTISVAVNPLAATGTLTATLDGSTALTVTAGGGAGVFNIALPATPLTVGSHSIALTFNGTGSYASTTGSISLTVTGPTYVVNTTADDATGTASHCPAGGASTPACSLRDALAAAAAAANGSNITFSPTVFSASNTAAQNTITLTNGTLNIPSNTTIKGLTTGSGSTVTNLVTVSGAGSYQIFSVNTGATATIDSLNMTKGDSPETGGAIYVPNGTVTVTNSTFSGNSALEGGAISFVQGNLTVTNSTFSGNSATTGGAMVLVEGRATVTGCTFSGNSVSSGSGGAITISEGTMTVTNSTFSANSAPKGSSGAIANSAGTMTVTNSTFSGNSAGGGGGAIYNGENDLIVTNSIFSGNSGTVEGGAILNLEGTVTESYNDYYGNSPSDGVTLSSTDVTGNPTLAPLGNYGGTTETMLPLPGSAAICAGASSAAGSGGITSDQRGEALSLTAANASAYTGAGGYCPQGGIDAGAVQTDYALSFSTEPEPISPATAIEPGTNFQAGVTLDEDGSAFIASSVSLPLTLTSTPSGATLTGGSATTSTTPGASAGVASYSTLQVNQTGSDDQLTANLALNTAPSVSISATSSQFNVALPATVTGVSPSSGPTLGGTNVTITGTNFSGTTAVLFGGAAASFTFVSSTTITAVSPAGTGTVDVTVTTPSGTSATSAADQFTYVQVPTTTSAAPATATYSATAQIVPLSAAVTSSSGTVKEGTVTFTVLKGTTPVGTATTGTVSNGSASANYTLPAATAAGTYTIQAAYSDASGNFATSSDSTHTLTVNAAATATTASLAAATYSASAQIVPMSVAVTSSSGTVNAGTVTFTVLNGVTPVGGAVTSGTVSNGSASVNYTLPAATAAGTYTIQAVYNAGGNFATSTDSTHTLSIAPASTITGLGVSSASITPGQSETLTATVTSAAGTPAGTVNFYDGTTLLSTGTLSGGVATYSTTTLAPGVTHALTATYSGNNNFTSSSTTASTAVTVAPLDFTLNLSGLTSQTVIPGQAVSFQFTVTPDYGSYAGTVTFTDTGLPPGATATFSPSSIPANGGPQTVTVTIQTAPSTAMEHTPSPPNSSGRRAAPLVLAFLALFGIGSLRKRGKAFRNLLSVAVLLVSGAAAVFLSGCGGVNGYFAQAPQNYAITITATSGALTHSGNVTLNVQ